MRGFFYASSKGYSISGGIKMKKLKIDVWNYLANHAYMAEAINVLLRSKE